MASCERTAKLYRSRRGMIFGVCQGIADWKGINAGYIRLSLVILTVFTGFFPFGLLYLIAAFFLPVEPAYKEKRSSYRRSHVKKGFYDLKQEFDDLASRFNGVDRTSTCSTGSGNERDWDRRFKDA
jgi:phage shock protein C